MILAKVAIDTLLLCYLCASLAQVKLNPVCPWSSDRIAMASLRALF
jgi:hypothetical protein